MIIHDDSLHIYQRTVGLDANDSLSVIAGLIEPGQTVLDVGMGSGSLGQCLSQRFAIVADGVTINLAEADVARAWYRQVLVADLDQADLSQLFKGKHYDIIVFADVLEHLKTPHLLLAQCRALLKPGGRLITSVPNASYCGLIAELIQGDFKYRPEGLLDSTHLRFFTRKSLTRFFDDNGWTTQSTQMTQRNLLASEFKVAFDSLPPAVARHLLAAPDALTYQFISVLLPQATLAPQQAAVAAALSSALQPTSLTEPAQALYSAQLYLSKKGEYSEASKIVAAGRIGEVRQTLAFDIPASLEPYTHIRLDPADRPGFFRLHHFLVRLPNGEVFWQWQSVDDKLSTLSEAPLNQILFSSPGIPSSGVYMLLHGDDPWIVLPFNEKQLAKIAQQGARLEVSAGWPMSADYLQASEAINAMAQAKNASSEMAALNVQKSLLQTRAFELIQAEMELHLTELNSTVNSRTDENLVLQCENRAVQSKLDFILAEQVLLNQDHENIQTQYKELAKERYQLVEELRLAQKTQADVQLKLNQSADYVRAIEHTKLFRAARTLSRITIRLGRFMGQAPRPQVAPQSIPKAKFNHPYPGIVDIIVPVYKGLDDTQRCLESVLAAQCQTNWRLIIINDCSPEPALCEWLRTFAQRDTRILLLENTENLGFVGTVNRGMALSQINDVLLLNSDTEVANDWLDRLHRAAYSTSHVGSVTPFSNNATICSYPRFCKANNLPAGYDTTTLDALFAKHLSGQTVEIPTSVGFCMFIQRQCLDEVGLFDVANFGKGYGEENDFCVRAQKAGWTHLHALDTFVKHAGGVSFGESKSTLEQNAMQTLRRLHPSYEADVHAYLARDPASQARLCIDIARITSSGHSVILNVVHNHGGGTLKHVLELTQELAEHSVFLRLSPAPGGVCLQLEGEHEAFSLHFDLPVDQSRLIQVLQQFQVGHIHYHHLIGHVPFISELPAQLGVTHDFTAHDFYSYCPQITLTDHTGQYCGEKGVDQCRQCLQRNPAPGGESIESWRARHARLLGRARYVIAPSRDTAQRIQRFVPNAQTVVVPHASLSVALADAPVPAPHPERRQRPLRIVVLGALSKIKGADVLEDLALLATRHDAPVEFHLLGYAYKCLSTQPKARLTVHGAYEDKDLPQLLAWIKPDLIWFPAIWPETYSYTLSAALGSGLPIVAPDLGAFPERLQNRPWTWLCDWTQSTAQWLAFFNQIQADNFRTGTTPHAVPKPNQATAHHEPLNGIALHYRGNYLQSNSLTLTLSPNNFQILEIMGHLAPYLLQPAVTFRLLSLKLLVQLRGMKVLSPLRDLVPIRIQGRIKSWLSR